MAQRFVKADIPLAPARSQEKPANSERNIQLVVTGTDAEVDDLVSALQVKVNEVVEAWQARQKQRKASANDKSNAG